MFKNHPLKNIFYFPAHPLSYAGNRLLIDVKFNEPDPAAGLQGLTADTH